MPTVSDFEQIVRDHGRRPRRRGVLPDADATGEASHPTSGEHFVVSVRYDAAGRIADIRFEGDGSVLSIASASLMTESVLGCTPQEAIGQAALFRAAVTGSPEAPLPKRTPPEFAAFAGIRQYPVRVPCALLGWQALQRALTMRPVPVR